MDSTPPATIARADGDGLPAAPASVVDGDGRILFGRYRGETGPIDWSRAGPSRIWRFFHHKRWQYAAVVGRDAVAAVAIVDLGWAGSAFAYFFDRRVGRVLADISMTAPPGSARVADHVRDGSRSSFDGGRAQLVVERAGGVWHVQASHPDLFLDVDLAEGPASATICAIAAVRGGVANCTHKTHGLGVAGVVRVGGQEIPLAGSAGALDATNGLLARNTSWRWASASSGEVAINLVEGFQDPVENAVWHRGVITPLPAVEFVRNSPDPLSSWHVRDAGGVVDLTFRAEGIRSQDKNLTVAVSRWIQPIGTWAGSVRGVDIGELSGVLEDHVARW